MGDSQHVRFVSQKINKVRWRPTRSALQKPDLFVAGSWEDSKNSVSVWSVENISDAMEEDLENERLRCVHKCKMSGDVNAISYLDPDNIMVGQGDGEVLLLRYSNDTRTLDVVQEWPKLHEISGVVAPCTGIDTSVPDVATVGEDGNINILRIGSDKPLRRIAKADSVPTSAVCYAKQNEICTVNKMGQLKIWDLRNSRDEPTRIIISSEELTSLESVCRHPTRPHILATGGADGCITTFDVRKEAAPITKIEVHDMEVWEVCFHPTSPDNLFSCSEDGAVRKLDITSELKNQESGISASNRPPVDVIELLNCHNMAVNSIAVAGSRLVCGTDAESIYVIENIS